MARYVGVTSYSAVIEEPALAAARGESGARPDCQGKPGRNCLEQPIAGHTGKWEWALCATVLSEGHAFSSGTGTATGRAASPWPVGRPSAQEDGSHSVKFIEEEARQARMRLPGGWCMCVNSSQLAIFCLP